MANSVQQKIKECKDQCQSLAYQIKKIGAEQIHKTLKMKADSEDFENLKQVVFTLKTNVFKTMQVLVEDMRLQLPNPDETLNSKSNKLASHIQMLQSVVNSQTFRQELCTVHSSVS